MVGGESQWQQGPHKWSRVMRSYYLLFLTGSEGGRHTMAVEEADAKMEVSANSEEVK